MYEEFFREEQLVRKEEKIGRNDLCPCGSGKKYKKCCMDKDLHHQQYITAHAQNYQQKRDNVQAFSVKEIDAMALYELEELDVQNMSAAQVTAAFRNACGMDIPLALRFLKEMRKFYEDTNGVLPRKEDKYLKYLKKRYNLSGIDDHYDHYDHYDHWIMDLEFNIAYEDRLKFAPEILKLFFNRENDDYREVELLCNIYQKNNEAVLEYIERVCIQGFEDAGKIIELLYAIRHHYPGIAVMLFRAVVATIPDHELEILELHNHIRKIYNDFDHDIHEDPSLAVVDMVRDLEDEDYGRDIEGNTREELQILKKELREAHAESAAQKKKINQLTRKRETADLRAHKTSVDEELIKKSREKIDYLKQIIRSKQEAYRELKDQVQESAVHEDAEESAETFEEAVSEYEMRALPFSIPVFPEKFQKSIQMFDPGIRKKAVEAFTGFCTRSQEVFRETKKLRTGGSHYSIRLGIHYRLLINCAESDRPVPIQVIKREDLDTAIKRIKKQYVNRVNPDK